RRGYGHGQRSALHTWHCADAMGRRQAKRLWAYTWARRFTRTRKRSAHPRELPVVHSRSVGVQLHAASRAPIWRVVAAICLGIDFAIVTVVAPNVSALARAANALRFLELATADEALFTFPEASILTVN